MPKKIKQILLFIVVSLLASFLLVLYQSFFWRFFVKDGQLVKLALKDNYFSSIKKELALEVVKNESSMQQGLSNRAHLKTVSGQDIDAMLFIFPETKIHQFWMKDMQFDIDICWIENRKLLDCTRQALKPKLDEDDDQLKIYHSSQPANMVLETMPGFLSNEHLGSQLYLRLF